MNKVLVIPDVHHKTVIADKILAKESYTELVWLGDFFDDWNDTPFEAARVAQWLEQQDGIKLLGNHDAPYLWPNIQELRCSGHTTEKRYAIQQNMDIVKYRNDVRLYYEVDGWLLSHAGIHPSFWPAPKDVKETLDVGQSHYFVEAGRDRGGWNEVGGVNWIDWSSLESIEGYHQLVGHTFNREVRSRNGDWCIDTGLHNYAILLDGRLEIKSI